MAKSAPKAANFNRKCVHHGYKLLGIYDMAYNLAIHEDQYSHKLQLWRPLILPQTETV